MANTPLGVLDLVPISSGSTAAQALRNSIDLAQQYERLGYTRYWFAEHHLNPGVAGSSPAVLLALTAAATSTIRIGSGAVQLGHRTALSTVEEFGLIDALHPGRLDLGLGRSGGKPPAAALEPALAPALVGASGGYAPWVRSIRTAEGAILYPTPEEARRHPWTDEDREIVADRVETQFVGTAAQVADQLELLRDATGADELIITTITHDHADRVRSYELLAREWQRR
jgi:alkanesulfonate monooxygenase SsuD/methylene tetrahydromethanopterin reductase-like flavin-dependent oxidoreductase (luciferase family)